MNTEKQIHYMNLMLNYLGKSSYSLKYGASYKETVLTYTVTDSIMRKAVTEWDYNGKIKSRSEKEKAFGGHNGNAMYDAIKKETLQRAEKAVLKTAVERELAEYDIDARDL